MEVKKQIGFVIIVTCSTSISWNVWGWTRVKKNQCRNWFWSSMSLGSHLWNELFSCMLKHICYLLSLAYKSSHERLKLSKVKFLFWRSLLDEYDLVSRSATLTPNSGNSKFFPMSGPSVYKQHCGQTNQSCEEYQRTTAPWISTFISRETTRDISEEAPSKKHIAYWIHKQA